MPNFEVLSVSDAKKKTIGERRATIRQQYAEYLIEVRATGKAGKLTPLDGETTAAIRRRLGTAAESMGTDVTIKRAGDEVFFWLRGMEGTRGRGRPLKQPSPGG